MRLFQSRSFARVACVCWLVLLAVLAPPGAVAQVINGTPRTVTASTDVDINIGREDPSITVSLAGTWVGSWTPFADPDGSGPLQPVPVQVRELQGDGTWATATVPITANGTFQVSNPGFMRVTFRWVATSGSPTLTAVRGGAAPSDTTLTGDVEINTAGLATSANQSTQITAIGATNTALGTLNTSVGATNTALGTLNTSVGAVTTAVGAVNTSVGATNTALGVLNAGLLDFNTGGATENRVGFGLLLPTAGGAVIGGTATNPVRTDPTGTTTQPVSLASVPTHAVTQSGAFTFSGTGTAGSPATGVVTAQGITGMTPFLVNFDGTAAAGDLTSAAQSLTTLINNLNQDAEQDAVISGSIRGPISFGMCDSTSTVAITENRAGSLRLNCTTRALMVEVTNGGSGGTSSNFASAFPSAGTAIGFTNGTNMVPATILETQAANVPMTTDGIVTTALIYCYDGTNFDPCPSGAGGSGTIDANTSRMVLATDDVVSVGIGKLNTQMVADGAATAGNPVYVGGLATTSIVTQTPVANAQRIGFVGGVDRVQITRPHSNLEDVVRGSAAITDGSSTSVVAAQGSGVKFCATAIVVGNSSASNVSVDLRDGTGGSVILPAIPASATQGGAVVPLQSPLCTSANTALAADPSAAASTVTVFAIGFKTEL